MGDSIAISILVVPFAYVGAYCICACISKVIYGKWMF